VSQPFLNIFFLYTYNILLIPALLYSEVRKERVLCVREKESERVRDRGKKKER